MLKPFEKLRQQQELWDLFSRKEEYTPRQLDQYFRFVHSCSSCKEIQTPVVSKFLVENGLDIEYPDGQSFGVCLTHDVDEIYPPPRHAFLSTLACIKNRDMSRIKDHLFWKWQGKGESPYRRFKEIIDLEDRYDAHSSFYFIATDLDIRRFRYNIEDVEEELGQILDRGGEVGLHGGYYSYNDLEMILEEKGRLEKALGQKVLGYRNHYLRFNVPDTWILLAKAGFKYDTTLGYPDTIGFRNGMCHPFHPIDLTDNEKVLDILEIPMVIMDGTLFKSMKSYDETWAVTTKLIDSVISCHGVLTLNWHSNSFNCPYKDAWSKIYEKILKYCAVRNAWMTNGMEIWKWWNK